MSKNHYPSGDWLEKLCSRCQQIKTKSCFSRDIQHSSGHKSACKDCAKKDWDDWRNKNLHSSRKKDRISHYKKKYGLSQEEAERLSNSRIGTCKICGKIKELVVDHCHTTNIVRGYICSSCNSVLGYCKDNIKILQNTIQYLKDFYG